MLGQGLKITLVFLFLTGFCSPHHCHDRSEVDIVEENDYTGIVSFPDFKIPSNPKYFKVFVNKVFSKKHIWNFSL